MSALDLEEQEQLAELKSWWKRHGNLVMTIITVLLLAIAAWHGWNWYQRSQSGQAAALYETVQKAAAAKDLKALRDAAGQVLEQYPRTVYAGFAALISARVHLESADSKTARAQLEWVVSKGATDELQSVARLRLASLLLDEQGADEALKLLDAKPAASYEPLFAATRGDILLVQKKPAEARAAYKLALDKADSRDATLKQSVQQRLDAIGAGS